MKFMVYRTKEGVLMMELFEISNNDDLDVAAEKLKGILIEVSVEV